MDISLVFTPEGLAQLPVSRLRKIAQYYQIEIPKNAKKKEILKALLDKFSSPLSEIPPSKQAIPPLLPDETPDNPKYSVRVRRILWAAIEKG